MISLTVNGRKIAARPGEMLISALSRAGIKVPALCHIPGLKPSGACRLCVVELEGEDELIPSCSVPVRNKMVLYTHSPRVITARKTILELILLHHPNHCLYCTKNDACKLRILADEYGVRPPEHHIRTIDRTLDITGNSVIYDPAKCITCGNCARICNEKLKIGVIDYCGRGSGTYIASAFKQKISTSNCVECGLCLKDCPTAAITVMDSTAPVTKALNDPEIVPVVQYPYLIAAALAEHFGFRPGIDISGQLNAALRQMGFHAVFDSESGIDIMVEENAAELAERRKSSIFFPLLTNRSAAIIMLIMRYYPALMPMLSSSRSPQGIVGTLIRKIYAEAHHLDPAKIYSVSLMPCTSKKTEAAIPIFREGSFPDVNAVLTSLEVIRMLKLYGLDLTRMPSEPKDTLLAEAAPSSTLFPVFGTLSNAVAAAYYHRMTGNRLKNPEIKLIREGSDFQEILIKKGSFQFRAIRLNGAAVLQDFLNEYLQNPRKDLDFVDAMFCPGGCLSGSGLPDDTIPGRLRLRLENFYSNAVSARSDSQRKTVVKEFYQNILQEPPYGPKAKQMFHIDLWRKV